MVWEPVCGGRGSSKQAGSCRSSSPSLSLSSSLAPRSPKLPAETHARRCPFSTTSSGCTGQTGWYPPLGHCLGSALTPQECDPVSRHHHSPISSTPSPSSPPSPTALLGLRQHPFSRTDRNSVVRGFCGGTLFDFCGNWRGIKVVSLLSWQSCNAGGG